MSVTPAISRPQHTQQSSHSGCLPDLPQLLYSAPWCQARPCQPQSCSPCGKAVLPQTFLCSAGVIPSSRPCTKPVLPRAGGVKDGAATAKGGLSLTAPSTVACWMPLGPRMFFLMPLAGPCFSSGWTRRPSQYGMRKMKRNNLKGVLAADGRHKLRSDLTSTFVPRGTPSARGGGNRSLRLRGYLYKPGCAIRLKQLPPSSSGTPCRRPRCGA